MKILMAAFNYDTFKWQFFGNLKVIVLLLGIKKFSQNIAAFLGNGTAQIGLFLTQERIGLPENPWNQVS